MRYDRSYRGLLSIYEAKMAIEKSSSSDREQKPSGRPAGPRPSTGGEDEKDADKNNITSSPASAIGKMKMKDTAGVEENVDHQEQLHKHNDSTTQNLFILSKNVPTPESGWGIC